MKKTLGIITIILFALVLVACKGEKESTLVISKIFGPRDQFNNVIELYNNSDKDIDLGKYSLRFYTNGSKEVSQEIKLTGAIKANDYYVITGNMFDGASGVVADFKHTQSLPYNGNDAIELFNGKKGIDLVGYIGNDLEFVRNVTLIRLGNVSDYKADGSFDRFNFITYNPSVFQYIKNDNHEIKTLEDLLNGPRLEERYKDMPYVSSDNDTLGGGGAVSVTLTSVADGDTAYFTAKNGYPGGSMRYFYLDTPEVNGTYVSAEPWGYVASKYNKEYILNPSHIEEIYVQSIPDHNLKENNGRNIGLVWVNGHLSQFLVVAEGLSKPLSIVYNDYDLALSYKNVPFLTFLLFAEDRAFENGWGMKGYPSNPNGEKSPDWNYQGNSLATQSPIWTPHLPIPWIND